MATALYAPNGTVHDIPDDQLQAAIAAGGVRAVKMRDPEGKQRYIPLTSVQDAVKAGGRIDESTNTPKEGFWKSLGQDLGAMAKGTAMMIGPGALIEVGKHLGDNLQSVRATGKTLEEQAYQDRVAAGRSKPYAAGAGLNEALGVNVRGQEAAADNGDPGGVLGHAAAVPVAMAVGEGVARGVPPVVRGVRAGVEAIPASAVTKTGAVLREAGNNPIFEAVAPSTARRVNAGGRMIEATGKGLEARAAAKQQPKLDFSQIPATPREAATQPVALQRISDTPAPYQLGPGQVPADLLAAPDARVLAGNQGVRTTPLALLPESTTPPVIGTRPNIGPPVIELPAPGTMRARKYEDMAFQDAMREDLARHGSRAFAEERQQFAAGNSMDRNKGDIIADFKAQRPDLPKDISPYIVQSRPQMVGTPSAAAADTAYFQAAKLALGKGASVSDVAAVAQGLKESGTASGSLEGLLRESLKLAKKQRAKK